MAHNRLKVREGGSIVSFRRAGLVRCSVLAAILAWCYMTVPLVADEPVAPARMASPILLGEDGYFRTTDGRLYIPLGGLHGNFAPLSMLELTEQEEAAFEGKAWHRQADVLDMPEPVLRRWFELLKKNGVNSLRWFPRLRVGGDVLELCGKVNPDLKEGYSRVLAAAKDYDIRVLLQILPEPGRTGYWRDHGYIQRGFTKAELAGLTEAQKKFVVQRHRVQGKDFFESEDVMSCLKLYFSEALEWVSKEPQIFALEIYNEQGWHSSGRVEGEWKRVFIYPWEDAEIHWSAQIIEIMRKRLPEMPTCVSHPGFGVTGYDPFIWTHGAKADFYSSHLYSNLCGSSSEIDFSAVTGATTAICRAELRNFPGEWGTLDGRLDEGIRLRVHRDAVWLSLMAGASGFMQWSHRLPGAYLKVADVFAALPKGFSPAPGALAVNIGPEYRRFQDNSRYKSYSPDAIDAFAIVRQKHADGNLRRMYTAYLKSLKIGVPVRFTMGERGAMPLARFEKLDTNMMARPIIAVGGYQLAWMKDAGSPTYVGYLRSRRVEEVRNKFLAVAAEAPLTLKLDLPALAKGGAYTLHLLDLDTGKVSKHTAAADATIKVADSTSDDFVFILAPASGDIRLD